MGQPKFKPRQTMSRINKPAPIKYSGDHNMPPVDHRRNGLSRPKRCSWCIERGSEWASRRYYGSFAYIHRDCIKDHPHFKETGKCYWCYKNDKECTPSQTTSAKETLAIHKTLKTHIDNIKAIYEASLEVDDPEILKCFNFSKVSFKKYVMIIVT